MIRQSAPTQNIDIGKSIMAIGRLFTQFPSMPDAKDDRFVPLRRI
jgi:hypothetical protein